MTKPTCYDDLNVPAGVSPRSVFVSVALVASDPTDPSNLARTTDVVIGGSSEVTVDDDGHYEVDLAPNVREEIDPPEYRSISATAATASTSTPTLAVSKPASVVVGDWLLLAGFVGDATPFDPTLTDTLAIEAGWTLVDGPIASTATGSVNNVRGYLWKRLVDGSEASTFTLTKTGTGGYMRGVCVAVAGAGSGIDVHPTGTASAASDVTIPNAVPTVAGTLSLAIIGVRGTLLTGTPPDGWSEKQDSGQTISPNVLVATKSNEAVGNTGTATYDLATSNTWVAFHVVLAATPENDDAIYSPEGTVYRQTVKWPDGTTDVEYFPVPDGAGPYRISDLLSNEPGSLLPAGAAASSSTFITTTDQTVTLPQSTPLATLIEEGTSFPGSAVEGQLFRRTDEAVTYRYSGLTWVAWTDTAAATGYTPQNRVIREADDTTQEAVARIDSHVTGGIGTPLFAGPQLKTWRTAITDLSLGNGPVNVWVVGNSISEFYYAGSRGNGWHNVTADRLAQRLGYPTNGYRYLPFNKTATPHPYNPWTYGSGVTLNTESASGDPGYGIGRWSVDVHAGENVTTTSNVVCDRVLAVYSKKSGAGTAELYIDGALVTSASAAGSSRSTYALDSGALTLGAHEIKVMASGGTVIFEGALVCTGDYAGVRWINCSKAGATTLHFNTAGTAGATAFDGMADTFPPDLVIFELGSNDISFSLGAASIRAQLALQIDAINAKSTVDPSIVMLVSPPNSYTQIAWENLVAAMYLLAQDYPSQVSVIDLANAMVTTASGDFHTGSSDTVHPGPLGHTFWGETVAEWLLASIGAPPLVISGGTP